MAKGFRRSRRILKTTARALFNRSQSTRSCQLIHDSWQDLGLPGRAFVISIITRICQQAGAADGGNLTSAESEAALTDDAAVNVPLLAAYLQLCRAIDLKSPATILQIISHIPEDNRISPGSMSWPGSISWVRTNVS